MYNPKPQHCVCDEPFSDCPYATEMPHGDKWYCELKTKKSNHKKMENHFNENLKRLRLRTRSSQSEISNLLGVNVKTYSTWEKNTEPNISRLKQISKLFGITMHEMLTTKID